MGADAEIFVFDYQRYRDEVVPAFVELLRTGEPVPWLGEVFRSATPMGEYGYDVVWPRLAAQLREQPTDLARYCTWLGRDLRYLGGREVDRSAGKLLTCSSLTCPERVRCRFHQGGDLQVVEELNALHEALVALRCLGPSQFLGRTITPNFYLPVLERQDVPTGDPLRNLLDALATRGAAVGYQFGVTEGIHGWLTVAETAELAARLDRLDLPRYQPTFAAMADRSKRGGFSASEWQELSLSFVRTVATVAACAGRAVLWGHDVCPDVWRERLAVAAPR
ncbi:hypothetical protein ONA91_36840 [Micromonospora sp. DR5-3]|uniref:hypothetical protein n=1 Tax=unclassified Micromonospora TaxID=2617518 RepID=UPI0011D5B376|nr:MULTISPECIES: hypothetical protein [unclassified Micromonospora]MCW3820014.1 hypothetical protein [Micromonospora sp. DR5-3]TYC12624.1 hypothetical protein FXF52_40200 [Micromonospora sp. MP36]